MRVFTKRRTYTHLAGGRARVVGLALSSVGARNFPVALRAVYTTRLSSSVPVRSEARTTTTTRPRRFCKCATLQYNCKTLQGSRRATTRAENIFSHNLAFSVAPRRLRRGQRPSSLSLSRVPPPPPLPASLPFPSSRSPPPAHPSDVDDISRAPPAAFQAARPLQPLHNRCSTLIIG